MPREVKRRYSSSDFLYWGAKENKVLTVTPKKQNYENVCVRKLAVNQSTSNNANSSNSDKVFIPSNINVFVDNAKQEIKTEEKISHSQENISEEDSLPTVNVTKRTRLRRSVSLKILPLIESYEKINTRELHSNEEVRKFLHKRVKQLRTADNFAAEIETPMGVCNELIPCTPVKVKHRRSKSQKLKSAVNITAQLFQYSDDIIHFYETMEDERKIICSGFKRRLISSHEWKNSVRNIVILAIKLHFPPALSYHAVRIIDDLFCMGISQDIHPRLLEITSLWLIAKKDYVYSKLPTIEKVIQYSSYFFTLKELTDCEWRILKHLKFNISYPDLISIVMYNVKTSYGCDYTHVNFGSYYYIGAFMLDVLLFNRKVIQKSSLLIAGVISSFTKIILSSNDNNFETGEINKWIPDRIKLSFPVSEKNLIIENLILGIKKSFNKNCDENIIFQKYQKLRYSKIANILEKKFASYMNQL